MNTSRGRPAGRARAQRYPRQQPRTWDTEQEVGKRREEVGVRVYLLARDGRWCERSNIKLGTGAGSVGNADDVKYAQTNFQPARRATHCGGGRRVADAAGVLSTPPPGRFSGNKTVPLRATRPYFQVLGRRTKVEHACFFVILIFSIPTSETVRCLRLNLDTCFTWSSHIRIGRLALNARLCRPRT